VTQTVWLSIDHGIGNVEAKPGSWPVSPTVTTTYVMTATGPGGTATASALVTIVEVGDTQTRSADGMVMVYVPSGTFQMGSTDADLDYVVQQLCKYQSGCGRALFGDEQPAHPVTLRGFWIDRTEVSYGQYRKCYEEGVCRDAGCEEGISHPAICVGWEDAKTYCEWAGGRLPTEAEWEFAARGPDERMFPWGDTFDGTRLNFCDANCDKDWKATEYNDGYPDTAPVGSYQAGRSWCGALDMAGNAWEWVGDWYYQNYYRLSPQQNPTGPMSGSFRVLRGGSWDSAPQSVRSTVRLKGTPGHQDFTFGFRCAVSPGE
jgi:formylglycine-generating enzyme required for sulfatase activity